MEPSAPPIRRHLVSFASGAFMESQRVLEASARRHGVERVHSWNRPRLEATDWYGRHRAILDVPRGGGCWLWKPYIVRHALDSMADGEVLFYCDAGIEIIGDLSPLVRLCIEVGGILLFAGHYEDVVAPGPNVCGKWTKRDCFVAMGCDEPRFHEATMVDASFMVLSRNAATLDLVDAWRRWCEHDRLITDDPSRLGVPELPGFIEHRHDQSILSLLAHRRGLTLRRHPSQMGNHVKEAARRLPGEWTRLPWGQSPPCADSPYGTLLDHHRGQRRWPWMRRQLRPYLGPARRWLRAQGWWA